MAAWSHETRGGRPRAVQALRVELCENGDETSCGPDVPLLDPVLGEAKRPGFLRAHDQGLGDGAYFHGFGR